MTSLTYDNLSVEHCGVASALKLKLSPGNIQYKYEDTGKSGHFEPSIINNIEWLYRARGFCLCFKLNNGKRHYFDGFPENEYEKLAQFIKDNYELKLEVVETSLKGINYGGIEFDGQYMDFKIGGKRGIDINLKDVVHVSKSKNELIIQFQTNDEAISVYEMRFGAVNPQNEEAIDEMYEKIMREANVLEARGESLVVLEDMHCLQPRGRYEIKVYPEFIHMRGKTYDYSVPKDNFVRFYLLPHPDDRQLFFVLQINPPITHGQTRYYFIVLLFDNEETISIELNSTDEMLREKYNDSVQKSMSGGTYEVVTRLFKAIYGQKLTIPNRFESKAKSKAIACSYKTTNGFLYPLEKGFIFVPKPTVSIRSDEIACVNLSRASIMQRTFDFDIETKNGLVHTFTGVDKTEYNGLFEFVKSKSYVMSNGENMSKREDWSASEDSPDEYLERMKMEGGSRRHKPVRETFAVDDDEDDEEDEDFRPPDESSVSSVAEEYDSEVNSTTGEGSSDSDSSGGHKPVTKTKESIKKQVVKKKMEKPATSTSDRKPKGTKKVKDVNAPKKPMTAFILYSNDIRAEVIKTLPAKHSIGDVAKIIGERWKSLTDAEKAKYAERYSQERKRYEEAMKHYVPPATIGTPSAPKPKPKSKKQETSQTKLNVGVFKSEEYVQSSPSSSD